MFIVDGDGDLRLYPAKMAVQMTNDNLKLNLLDAWRHLLLYVIRNQTLVHLCQILPAICPASSRPVVGFLVTKQLGTGNKKRIRNSGPGCPARVQLFGTQIIIRSFNVGQVWNLSVVASVPLRISLGMQGPQLCATITGASFALSWRPQR